MRLPFMEWEAHRLAKERVVQIFQNAGWEAKDEVPTPIISEIDGTLHPYTCDVIGILKNNAGLVRKRIIVEIDSIHAGCKSGHKSFRAYHLDKARAAAICSHFYCIDRYAFTTLKRLFTTDCIGKYKQDDSLIRLELGIDSLQKWRADNCI